MTTPPAHDPLDDIPMTYSAVFIPTEGYSNPLLPEQMRNSTTFVPQRLALYPGVSSIDVSWDGEESIKIHHWRDGASYEVLEIPGAPAGEQRTESFVVSHERSTQISVLMPAPDSSAESILSSRRIAVTVIPSPVPTEKIDTD